MAALTALTSHSWTLWLVKDFLSQRLLVAELLEFFTSFTNCLMLCLNRCCHNPRMHLCHNYATLMSQSKNTQLKLMGSEGAKGNTCTFTTWGALHQGWVVRSTDWHSWTSQLNRCAKCNGDELLNSWRAIKYAQTYSWGRSARKLADMLEMCDWFYHRATFQGRVLAWGKSFAKWRLQIAMCNIAKQGSINQTLFLNCPLKTNSYCNRKQIVWACWACWGGMT